MTIGLLRLRTLLEFDSIQEVRVWAESCGYPLCRPHPQRTGCFIEMPISGETVAALVEIRRSEKGADWSPKFYRRDYRPAVKPVSGRRQPGSPTARSWQRPMPTYSRLASWVPIDPLVEPLGFDSVINLVVWCRWRGIRLQWADGQTMIRQDYAEAIRRAYEAGDYGWLGLEPAGIVRNLTQKKETRKYV
jgi:hypothetical protein